MKQKDQALACKCGSVKFAVRKDHCLECHKCGKVLRGKRWVEYTKDKRKFMDDYSGDVLALCNPFE